MKRWSQIFQDNTGCLAAQRRYHAGVVGVHKYDNSHLSLCCPYLGALKTRWPVFEATKSAMVFLRCKQVLLTWALTSYLITLALSQGTSDRMALSPHPFLPSDDGRFDWQEGLATLILNEGSETNISWKTSFPSANLWLIANATWNAPIRIVGTSDIDAKEYLLLDTDRQ